MPRAGSTFLSHLLWRTGCLGAPLEYLNFEPAGPYGFATASPDLQRRLWRSVLRRRCSTNGVFGLKAFPPQLEQLKRRNPELLKDVLSVILPQGKPRKILYLRRRDRIAQAVSYARASMSGIWRKDQEGATATPIQYSDEAIEAAERGILLQESVWEEMLSDLGIEPLNLWFEDVLANPESAAEAVADHLGVRIDRCAAVEVPQIEKQSEEDSLAWAERYARRRSTLQEF